MTWKENNKYRDVWLNRKRMKRESQEQSESFGERQTAVENLRKGNNEHVALVYISTMSFQIEHVPLNQHFIDDMRTIACCQH